MLIDERQKRILEELQNDPGITIAALAKKLFVSEPTVRRDLAELHRKKYVTRVYGGAILNAGAADREIPFTLRENEHSAAKALIGRQAAEEIRDGMVILLDASTSAFHLIPYLSRYKDLIVVTSGAKTAVALAEAGIKTFSTGGQMLVHSFSYVGDAAEEFLRRIHADLLFFSCHGVNASGDMTERSIEEANLRRAMFLHAERKILLCDSSKFNKTYFYDMGNIRDVDRVISDVPLPEEFLTDPDGARNGSLPSGVL